MPDLFSVADQVVLVSGASRGIGLALAQGFAERGARVVITGREAATLDQEAAGLSAAARHPVVPIVCDVAKKADIDRTVERTLAEVGPIDVLLNVAGVNRRKPAEEVTEEDFDFILDINLKGAFLMAQAVGRGMLARGRGNQIHVVSLNNYAPLPWVLPYAASKAALGHLTRGLATEWGPQGVRVNAIAPGFILTDLSKALWANPVMRAWGEQNAPLGRLGVPEDLVGTALFLASEASAYMTGQVLFVDGGFSAGLPWPIAQVPRAATVAASPKT